MLSDTISSRLRSLKAAPAQSCGHLRVIPLTGQSLAEPTYRLLAPDTGPDVEIGEVGSGTVPTLRIKNRLAERLLIIDSQTIVGLRQNRTLNTDVLVPAGAELEVPVSCVEAGRWGAARAASVSPDLVPRALRSSKSSSVLHCLSASGRYASDQHEVWNHVSSYLSRSGSRSPTSAVHDAFEQQHAKLEEARKTLTLPSGTVGVAIYLNDRFLGLDLFDKATTMEAKWHPVLNSYSLEWLIAQEGAAPAQDTPGLRLELDEVIGTLSRGEWSVFDSPGEGRSLRMTSEAIVASSLVHGEDRIVHLQAFPVENTPSRPPWADAARQTSAARFVDDEPDVERSVYSSTPQVEGRPAGVRCPGCGLLYGTVMTDRGVYCNHCGHDGRGVP